MNVPMNIQHVSIDCQLGLKGRRQQISVRTDLTYVEDVKEPGQVLPPSSDRIFVIFGMKETRDGISFTLLNNPHLDRGHSAMIDLGRRTTSASITHVVKCSIASNTD